MSSTPIVQNGDIVVSRRQLITAVTATCLGWSLDLFDLFILLYMAPVLGQLFFPSSRPTLSLAAVYASFAVTLLMRPFGAGIFGSYADRHGRRGTMIIAVIGVGVSTALFGALPTIHQVGVIAPVIFLILRLVQGTFVGGVVASTHTIGTESVPAQWRGCMSGFIGAGGAGIGALLASFVFLITSSLFPGDRFAVWGWRAMFFSGLLSAVLGIAIFNFLEESPFFKRLSESRLAARAAGTGLQRSPVRTLFSSEYRGVLFLNLLLVFGGGAGYYLTSGYLPTFLKLVNHVPNTAASKILMLSSASVVVIAPLVGYISDKVGRKKVFLTVGVLAVVLVPYLYLRMAATTDMGSILGYAVALSILGNAGYCPTLIFLNERFPTALRATGTALSWNIGYSLGGMMPTFASLASGSTRGIPVALAAFSAVVFLFYLAGAILVPETRGQLL
jgi:MFS family permease